MTVPVGERVWDAVFGDLTYHKILGIAYDEHVRTSTQLRQWVRKEVRRAVDQGFDAVPKSVAVNELIRQLGAEGDRRLVIHHCQCEPAGTNCDFILYDWKDAKNSEDSFHENGWRVEPIPEFL